MIGDMASNLGQAPLRAQQEDSYMPYVTAVGTPLAVGAMAGIGTQNTGQFVNNLANPLAGTGDLANNLGNKYLPNAYRYNPRAFRPNSENFYHRTENYTDNILGDRLVPWTQGNPELANKLLRKEENTINLFKTKSLPDELYWSKGVPLDGRYHPQNYKGSHVWEMPSSMQSVNKVNGKVQAFDDSIGAYKVNTEPLYVSDAKLYREDWLQGYKSINIKSDNTVSNPLIPIYRATQGQEEPKKFQQGGKFTENENKFLEELAQLKLI
jgi:hypothetical protein